MGVKHSAGIEDLSRLTRVAAGRDTGQRCVWSGGKCNVFVALLPGMWVLRYSARTVQVGNRNGALALVFVWCPSPYV